MKVRVLLPLAALGSAVVYLRLLTNRGRTVYPAPESLIISHVTDLLAPPDGQHNRNIPLEGAANLRDIGGYRTSDGRYVRWGRVYRSGAISGLTDDDLQTVSALGLKLVCDLRGDEEVRTFPDRLPDTVEYARFPINPDRRGENRARLRALLFDQKRLGLMILDIYRRAVDENAAAFGRVIQRLADAHNLPTLIHCTAGKDRAGLAVALLLLAIGVPEEVVIADYSLSNRHYDFFARYTRRYVRQLAILGVTNADMYPMLTADPKTLRSALAYLVERYGSVQDYLRDRAGVDDATLERVKANLLT